MRGLKDRVDIDLDIGLDQIPEGPPCPICGSPTDKTFVQHKAYGESVEVRWDRAPGYECRPCEITMVSPEAVVQSLSLARDELAERHESDTAKAFDEVIASTQAFIDRRNASAPRNILRPTG